MLQDSTNTWKAFSASCWLWKHFPCKQLLRSGSQLARGQVNMVEKAKLHGPIYSTFEALVVRYVVGHCHGEELGSFCWQMPAAGVVVCSTSHRFLSMLLRYNSFTGIQKAVVDQMGSRPPSSDHGIFWCKFDFGKCFGASSLSNHCRWLLYKVLFSSHIIIWLRNGLLLLHRIREDDISKWQFFWFMGSSWGTHLLPFQFASNAEWRRMVDTEFFGNFSLVVVRGSALMILSIDHCQLPVASHCILHLQGFRLHCKTSWTTKFGSLYVG